MNRPKRLLSSVLQLARGQSHDLGKMDFPALLAAFFVFPTVLLYLALAVLTLWLALDLGIAATPGAAALAAVATFLVYALVWYLLHRFVLHSRFLYKHRLTARLWKRIHYDHHQFPHDMAVLFGAPITTIPTMVVVTVPLGWAIAGPAGGAFALFSALVTTLLYEFCHCCQHLNYTPRQRWLQRSKKLHMAHHFFDEAGNYGIISFWPDVVFGTLYEQPASRRRSATVFNLGYDAAEAQAYPWVAALSRKRTPEPEVRPEHSEAAGRGFR